MRGLSHPEVDPPSVHMYMRISEFLPIDFLCAVALHHDDDVQLLLSTVDYVDAVPPYDDAVVVCVCIYHRHEFCGLENKSCPGVASATTTNRSFRN